MIHPDYIRSTTEYLNDTLLRKNQDYGDSFSKQFQKYGLISVLIRLEDKLSRLETLSRQPAQVEESIEDTLLDIAGYAILALIEVSRHNTTKEKEVE